MEIAIKTAHTVARLYIWDQGPDNDLRRRSFRAYKVGEMELSKVYARSVIGSFSR